METRKELLIRRFRETINDPDRSYYYDNEDSWVQTRLGADITIRCQCDYSRGNNTEIRYEIEMDNETFVERLTKTEFEELNALAKAREELDNPSDDSTSSDGDTSTPTIDLSPIDKIIVQDIFNMGLANRNPSA